MALYAANNIASAVENFADRGYASVRGIILNRRDAEDEEAKVRAFSQKRGIPIIADIPRSRDILRFEDQGKTVIEGDPELPVSKKFIELAQLLLREDEA